MKENILKHGLVTRLRSPSVYEGGISHGMMTDEDPIPFSKLVGLGGRPRPQPGEPPDAEVGTQIY